MLCFFSAKDDEYDGSGDRLVFLYVKKTPGSSLDLHLPPLYVMLSFQNDDLGDLLWDGFSHALAYPRHLLHWTLPGEQFALANQTDPPIV